MAARAEVVLPAPDGSRELPAIPEASDVRLTPEEWSKVRAGDWVVQVVRRGEEDLQARAIGYVRSSPVAMFDVAVDSEIAATFDEIESAVILESWPHGKRFDMVVEPHFLLPSYEFTSVSAFHDLHVAQTFGQIRGDFQRNEGTHSYLWDPERQETLAVVTFAFALKGVLSILPEKWILGLASRDLPKAIRRLDSIALGLAAEDPPRFRRVQASWQQLRPALEAGEHPGFLWSGPAAQTAARQ